MNHDVIIIGAGAAGLHAAGIAGQRGLRVLLIDHAPKLAEKIRISGGGRCNFTNRVVGPEHFLGENPDFCHAALAAYQPKDFISLMKHHGIAWHEKHKGQLFADRSSEDIINLLTRECDAGGVERWQPCKVLSVQRREGHANTPPGFELQTERGAVMAPQLVIATGGLSIPQIGASDWGYVTARQFGHRVVPTRPALVPLTFDAEHWQPFAALSGLAMPVQIECGEGLQRTRFDEDLLFTHRGLSGPAVLQISSFWQPGQAVQINLLPNQDIAAALINAKNQSRRRLNSHFAEFLPKRLAETWMMHFQANMKPSRKSKSNKPPLNAADQTLKVSISHDAAADISQRLLAEVGGQTLRELGQSLHQWKISPNGTEGFRKAEVTAGGVDTRELNPQTLESHKVSGLYFIGEVVDITGWLGGYNFQWAWASAAACARALVGAAK
jgi:predicted Rossmann fold flavoprotein